MNLILSVRRALTNRMSPGFDARLDGWLSRYESLQARRGISIGHAFVDDDEAMSAFGLPVAPDSQQAGILASLRLVAGVASARKDPVRAIMILGGDDIVPFWRLTNPVRDRIIDSDDVVLSDNPYGLCADESYMEPTVPVGRISDFGNESDFATAFEHLIERLDTPPSLNGALAAINKPWIEASGEAGAALTDPVELHVCPYYSVAAGDLAKRVLYFNLHGFDGEPAWRGYDASTDQFVDAIRPASFQAKSVSGAMLLSEACYGAQTINRTASNSCALSAQREGVAGFIGATGLAFGSWQRPILEVADSDSLAPQVLARISAGVAAGSALCDGRRAFVQALDHPITAYERKTALQYVLFGDPSLTAV